MSKNLSNLLEIVRLADALERSSFAPVVVDKHVVSARIQITGWLEKAIAEAMPIIDKFCEEKYGEFNEQTRIATLCSAASNASGIRLSDYDYIIFEHIVRQIESKQTN